jgi:signal peptidase II
MFKSRYLPVVIGSVVLLADFFTKHLIQYSLPLMNHHLTEYPYGGIGVFRDFFGIEFSITHAINLGAAWGMFSDWQIYLLFLRIFIIASVAIYAVFFNAIRSRDIPLALILAGAIGNVLDFFIYGHVVDMLHFVLWGYEYPVFNVADAAIFTGIVWLFILSWKDNEQPTPTTH